MRTLKQILCRHYWECIDKNTIVNEVLEQCVKCNLYLVFHKGTYAEYKTNKLPTNKGWEHITREVHE